MFDDYYKFAVGQNPYSFAVSHYNYNRSNPRTSHHKRTRYQEFSQFLRIFGRKYQRLGLTQSSWLTDIRGKTMLVDKVLRFENLREGVAELSSHLGLDGIEEFPHLNQSSSDDYRAFYTDEDRAYLAQVFARDLEMFGYDF